MVCVNWTQLVAAQPLALGSPLLCAGCLLQLTGLQLVAKFPA